jgi:hypothetical protein
VNGTEKYSNWIYELEAREEWHKRSITSSLDLTYSYAFHPNENCPPKVADLVIVAGIADTVLPKP